VFCFNINIERNIVIAKGNKFMAMEFWDIEVWSFLITMTMLLGVMVLSNAMRRLIKPLRQSLIPSSVLGGFLLLLIDFTLKRLFKISLFDNMTLEALTYHGLGLGVVAITLTSDRQSGVDKKKERRTIFDFGVTVVSTYLMQAVIGLIVTIGLFYVMGMFPSAGLLLPMGFGQGPGQAYNWGNVYQNFWGFDDGASYGLTLAALGFVSASIGGLIYLERWKRKGVIKSYANADEEVDPTGEAVADANEIPLSESMDKLTVQIALVFIGYFMTFLVMKGIDIIVETGVMGDFGYNTIRPLSWGFNFLFASFTAELLKTIMRLLKKGGLLKREYTSDFLQNRISGFMFDMMVVASIAAINLEAFKVRSFLVSLVIMCASGLVLTYWYCDFVCKRIFPSIRHESFLALFGMLTGTNSTGIILLREMDPTLKTPVAKYIFYQVVYASMFGFPMILLMGYAPRGLPQTWITFGAMIVLFAVMNIILFRSRIFKRKLN